MALGEYACFECGKALQASKGYVCCQHAHCPFCGEVVSIDHKFYWDDSCCKHLLIQYGSAWRGSYGEHRRSGLLTSARFIPIRYADDTERERWKRLMNLMPPALPLPKQVVKGYPVWSEEQLMMCYSLRLLPILQEFFGPELRRALERPDSSIALAFLFYILRPYVKVTLHWMLLDKYVEFFFLEAPELAMKNVEQVLTELAEGTRKLREMTPERFVVRPVPRLKPEHRWKALVDG